MTGLRYPKPVRAPKAPRKALRSRSPMKRGESIKRTWMKRRRPRRLDAVDREVMVNDFDGRGPRIEIKEGHDQERLDWCATRPCVVGATVPGEARKCRGVSVACHEGERKPGTAMKSPDSKSFSMCGDLNGHHAQWTDHRGFFKGWTKEQRRAFGDEHGAAAQAAFLSSGGRRGR